MSKTYQFNNNFVEIEVLKDNNPAEKPLLMSMTRNISTNNYILVKNKTEIAPFKNFIEGIPANSTLVIIEAAINELKIGDENPVLFIDIDQIYALDASEKTSSPLPKIR